MDNNKSLKDLSKEAMKENGLLGIIIFFFAGLLIAGVVLFDFFLSGLYILLVPLVVLPIMFSFYFCLLAIRTSPAITLGLFFRGIGLYFQERFRSTFSVLSNFARAALCYILVSIVVGLIVNLSFYGANFLNYQDFFNNLFNIATQEESEAFLAKYATLINIIQMSTTLPALILMSGYAFYRLSICSISFFLRSSGVDGSGRYLDYLFKKFLRNNRRTFVLDYLRLNWPMYLLMGVGYAVGGLLGYYFFKDAFIMFSFGFSFSLVLSFSVFGAKYFANKEALYLYYLEKINAEDKALKEEINKRTQEMFGSILEDKEENKNDSSES